MKYVFDNQQAEQFLQQLTDYAQDDMFSLPDLHSDAVVDMTRRQMNEYLLDLMESVVQHKRGMP